MHRAGGSNVGGGDSRRRTDPVEKGSKARESRLNGADNRRETSSCLSLRMNQEISRLRRATTRPVKEKSVQLWAGGFIGGGRRVLACCRTSDAWRSTSGLGVGFYSPSMYSFQRDMRSPSFRLSLDWEREFPFPDCTSFRRRCHGKLGSTP